MSYLFDDPEVKAFLELFGAEVLPKIKESALVCVIHSGDPDPKMCLEVGAAVLLEKPLILCARPGVMIPPVLRRLASRIVELESGDMTPATQERMSQAISAVIKDIERGRQ